MEIYLGKPQIFRNSTTLVINLQFKEEITRVLENIFNEMIIEKQPQNVQGTSKTVFKGHFFKKQKGPECAVPLNFL